MSMFSRITMAFCVPFFFVLGCVAALVYLAGLAFLAFISVYADLFSREPSFTWGYLRSLLPRLDRPFYL